MKNIYIVLLSVLGFGVSSQKSLHYLSNPKNGVNFTSWNPNYYSQQPLIYGPGAFKYSEFPANGKIIRALNFKRR
jgi:hypothetical protein